MLFKPLFSLPGARADSAVSEELAGRRSWAVGVMGQPWWERCSVIIKHVMVAGNGLWILLRAGEGGKGDQPLALRSSLGP